MLLLLLLVLCCWGCCCYCAAAVGINSDRISTHTCHANKLKYQVMSTTSCQVKPTMSRLALGGARSSAGHTAAAITINTTVKIRVTSGIEQQSLRRRFTAVLYWMVLSIRNTSICVKHLGLQNFKHGFFSIQELEFPGISDGLVSINSKERHSEVYTTPGSLGSGCCQL